MKKLFVIMFSLVSVGARAEKTFPRYTENEKAAVNRCRSIDTGALNDIKGQMIAVGILGTVATGGNAVSAIMTATNKGDVRNGQSMAANIITAAGATTSGVNTALSATSISKIQSVIDDLEACQKGLDSIPDSTNVHSDNDTYLKD